MQARMLVEMNPEESLQMFRGRLERAGLSLETLTPAQVLAQVLAFYREVRADRCVLDAEGDMLLFAWGARDSGDESLFQLEITRQFIQPGDEDEDGMSQLWVIMHFDLNPALEKVGEGEHWCESPDESDAFQEFVLAHEAYRAVVELTPAKVEVDWAMV
jgi:hypothetical protein